MIKFRHLICFLFFFQLAEVILSFSHMQVLKAHAQGIGGASVAVALSQRGFPQFRSNPGFEMSTGPWLGSMGTQLFFQSVPGRDESFDVVAGVGVSVDLINARRDVFQPQEFKVNLSLHPDSGLDSLSGELFLWSDLQKARSGTRWQPRVLRGVGTSRVEGSALVVAATAELGTLPGEVFDLAEILTANGGVEAGETITVYFADNRYPDSDQRHLRRIFVSKPNGLAFFSDDVAGVLAGLEGPRRFALAELPGVDCISYADLVVSSRAAGTYTRSIPIVSRSFGQGFVELFFVDIEPEQGQDPTLFGHSAILSARVFLPAAAGKNIILGNVKSDGVAHTRGPWNVLADGVLNEDGLQLELGGFEDVLPRRWQEDEQYFNALILQIDDEAYVLAAVKQGDLLNSQPSRGSTWPY